jgi:hypothetical protein
MSGPFIMMSKSRIKPGKADAYAAWSADMFCDVEEQEPRLLAFNVWESADHTSSVVIQVHPDAESFEYHLKLFGERVREAFDYIDVEGVEIYGPPSPFVEQFVTHGLPGMPVTVHPLHKAGFTRLQAV